MNLQSTFYIWLVVWFCFPHRLVIIIPIDYHILPYFSQGWLMVAQPPTRHVSSQVCRISPVCPTLGTPGTRRPGHRRTRCPGGPACCKCPSRHWKISRGPGLRKSWRCIDWHRLAPETGWKILEYYFPSIGNNHE